MKVEMPFLEEFRDPMLKGVKRCTARTKRYGEPGDYFEAFGKNFIFLLVTDMDLDLVAKHLWEEEGCSSEEDFKTVWRRIHPRKGFDPNWKVILHYFRKMKQQENKNDVKISKSLVLHLAR